MSQEKVKLFLECYKGEKFTINQIAINLKQDRSIFVNCNAIKEDIDNGIENDIKYEVKKDEMGKKRIYFYIENKEGIKQWFKRIMR